MKLYKYDNYQQYVEAQTEANVRKINHIWVHESTIKQIHQIKNSADIILCHGTRNATEQKLFKQYFPNASILGTEISHTASKFDMTIQHDFHEELESHINKCDIVYSNSFDHSYDPEKSLRTWLNQLNSNGYMFLELMTRGISKKSDPLYISPLELEEMVVTIGGQVVSQLNVKGDSTGGLRGEDRSTILMVIKK